MHRYTCVLITLCVFTLSACTGTPHVEFREASDVQMSGWSQKKARWNGEAVWVARGAFVTNSDIDRATVSQDHEGHRAVMLELNEIGQAKMLAHTQERIGQPVAVILNGELICAPRLMSALSHRAMIVGLSNAEIDRIVAAFERP